VTLTDSGFLSDPKATGNSTALKSGSVTADKHVWPKHICIVYFQTVL